MRRPFNSRPQCGKYRSFPLLVAKMSNNLSVAQANLHPQNGCGLGDVTSATSISLSQSRVCSSLSTSPDPWTAVQSSGVSGGTSTGWFGSGRHTGGHSLSHSADSGSAETSPGAAGTERFGESAPVWPWSFLKTKDGII